MKLGARGPLGIPCACTEAVAAAGIYADGFLLRACRPPGTASSEVLLLCVHLPAHLCPRGAHSQTVLWFYRNTVRPLKRVET